MTEIVLPQHANALGTAFGGTILSWIDVCAAICAQRHCSQVAVTAAIDEMQFLAPISVGDVVILNARINAAFRTSVEVMVRVAVEDRVTRGRTLAADALLTFVSRAKDGTPSEVPPLRLDTEEERERFEEAKARRAERLQRKRAHT